MGHYGHNCIWNWFYRVSLYIYFRKHWVMDMEHSLVLKNNVKETRTLAGLSQAQLAEMVGVSRNTISSIETGQFCPTAKLALILCVALDKKFEELFYFEG